MFGLGKKAGTLVSPRGILSLTLTLGMLSGQGGRGTLAFFTSSVVSDANQFTGGVVDIAGTLGGSGSTASVLTSSVFSWTASGASGSGATSSSATCKNILTGTDIRDQRMVPGQYCVAPIDINNNNPAAVDAWMRMRIVRATPYLATGNAQTDAATEALNDRLKFYMHEYSGGATAAANKSARDTDCTTTSYKPTWTSDGTATGTAVTAVGTAGSSATTNATYVFGTSSGKIFNGTVSGSVSRTALSTLEEIGKNLGAHPGISGVTVNTAATGTTTGSTHATKAAQDTVVTGLITAQQISTATTSGADADSTAYTAPANANGLRLKAGTSAAGSGTAGVAPAEANMVTALGSTPDSSISAAAPNARNAFNVVGTDGITNPVKLGATLTNTSAAPLTLTSPTITSPTTTNAGTIVSVTVSFTLGAAQTWTSDGQVIVTFPSGYTIGAVGTPTLAASTLVGTLGTLSASVNGQTVTVTRAGGSAFTTADGVISFALTNITMPSIPTNTTNTTLGNPANANATAVAGFNVPTFSVLSPVPALTGASTGSATFGTSATRVDSSARGKNVESEINKGQQRYYCAAIFLPSDTDTNFPVVYADSGTNVGFAVGLGATFNGTYNYTNGQYPTAGATTLGTGAAALTAANGKGDSAIASGDVRYYLVVSAAQKAGRTVN